MSNDVRSIGPYELFVLVLSVFALVLLGASASFPFDPEAHRLLDLGDLVICGFFFADFIRNMIQTPDRVRYFVTWGWLDLAASIPAVDALRLGRLGRIVRILRVLRLIKATRILLVALNERRRESAVWAALLVSIIIIFTASIAVLELERRAGGNITNAEDALWWSMTTITTVGYGDRYPVTTEGRLVAVALMIVGVGLFGALSGMATSVHGTGK
jgi:voltage-gated potassium channel